MKVNNWLILTLIFVLYTCAALNRVNRLIDQKEDYIWTGSNNEKQYVLTIDSSTGIWFKGKIIIDIQDTLYLKGFEKGSNHPTAVFKSKLDLLKQNSVGHIFIWTKGLTADTVKLNNGRDSIPQLPISLNLFKTKKKIN